QSGSSLCASVQLALLTLARLSELRSKAACPDQVICNVLAVEGKAATFMLTETDSEQPLSHAGS
ncbi:hypothetical protein CHARACLAT_012850, partial [Characodon lateralis]|nr:hypothetical protein [Characodon lateralis]